jgi:hypothetical protein
MFRCPSKITLVVLLLVPFAFYETANSQDRSKAITRNGLFKALRVKLRTKDLIILRDELNKRGLDFHINSKDEMQIRGNQQHLGKRNLDDLMVLLRNSYRTSRDRPDIALRLIYPTGLAVVMVNESDVVLREPKYVPAMWNLDGEKWHQPLPIPVASGDWIRPREAMGPKSFITQASILPLVKQGDRLFGVISVTCPDCIRSKAYWVYVKHGVAGWFSEIPEDHLVDLNALSKAIPEIRKDADRFFSSIPEEKRVKVVGPR